MFTRIMLGVLSVCLASPAQTLTTVAVFDQTNGGSTQSLAKGTDGNFYGVTGANGPGIFYKISTAGAFTQIATLGPTSANDIYSPNTFLTLGPDGNFYGTGVLGGTGYGGIFKITSKGIRSTVYQFSSALNSTYFSPSNATFPLLFGPDGNLYGETTGGGKFGAGGVFQLTLAGQLTLLFSFPSTSGGGYGLQLGPDGNFYDTVYRQTGQFTSGTFLYQISPSGSIFQGAELPALPQGPLLLGPDGNFYGIGEVFSGATGPVTEVFKLTTDGQFTLLSTPDALAQVQTDFVSPMIFGQDGNIYGAGYAGFSAGYIFKTTPAGALSIIYTFCKQSGCPDGQKPSGILQAADGSFFGTTATTVFHLQMAKPACANTAPPVVTSVQSAGAYGGYNYFASGPWLEIKGSNLADPSDPRLTAAINPGQWMASDFTGSNAPTKLDGISVNIDNQPAYVWYISPSQLNVQAPQDSTIANVSINATNCMGTSGPVSLARRATAPGLLAPSNYSSGGRQYLVATFSDGAYVLDTALGANFGINARPAKPNDTIIAYGIGFGDVTPSISPGVIAQSANALAAPVTFSFGTSPAAVSYQGLAGNFVGLYEFYITVPSGLTPGDYQITVTQGSTTLPQTLYLTVGK